MHSQRPDHSSSCGCTAVQQISIVCGKNHIGTHNTIDHNSNESVMQIMLSYNLVCGSNGSNCRKARVVVAEQNALHCLAMDLPTLLNSTNQLRVATGRISVKGRISFQN